jgi:hypothetical protein
MLTVSRREEASRQEYELQREKETQEARLRALEEEVRQGKIKKQEEKRRRQAAEREAKENEARLAAQRAELEAARERERQLQRELEELEEESSSDEEGPVNITPQDSTPTQSQVLPSRAVVSPPPPPPQAPSIPAPPPPHEPEKEPGTLASSPSSSRGATESRNPYFRQLSQSAESQTSAPTSPPQAASQAAVTSPKSDVPSTNPFHRLVQQQESAKSAFSAPPIPGPLERKSRARPEDDDWSVAESENDSSDDDDDNRAGGGSAKQLASILFGTMGPPRPLSAMDDKSPSKSATPVQENALVPPPPPPPPPAAPPAIPETNGSFEAPPSVPPPPPPPPPPSAPGLDAPSVPPPPPPPPAGAPAPPPAAAPKAPVGGGAALDRSALLSSIQAGRGLRKVETKDRSSSSFAGRVLG